VSVSPCSPAFEQEMENLVECGLAVAYGAEDPRLLLRYAEALWNVRDAQAAIPILDRAIAGEPPLTPLELSKAYALRSICTLQSGSLEQAFVDVETSLQVMHRARPLALRGMIHRYRGNLAQAIDDATSAVRLDPDDWEARAWRGKILFEAGRLQEAIDDFTWVIDCGRCEQYASELYLERAQAEYLLGNPSAALADCNQGIVLHFGEQARWPFVVPFRTREAHNVFLVRALIYLAAGAKRLALGDCFLALSLSPDDPVLYDFRAQVYHAIGNPSEAARDTARAVNLRQQPEDTGRIGELEAIRFAGGH
jgi:tetratricopeptide (TPR) repeat protein